MVASRESVMVPHRGADWLVGGGEMGELVRAYDWSKTPLGPIDTWPQSLRTAVSLCLSSTFPMNIIWGPDSTQIYNDGYRVVCGAVHPRALGESYKVTWASAWPAIGDSFDGAWAGERTFIQNQRMFLMRLNGAPEETFFTYSHSPIQDESGQVGGLLHPVNETTATMLAERRTRALRDLAARLAGAADESDVARRCVEVLARFDFDLPFVLYYVFDPKTKRYELSAQHGIPTGTAATPPDIAPEDHAPWPFARTLACSSVVEIDDLPATLGGLACGPYEEPPRRGLAIPIVVPAADHVPAVIVTAASSRLPWDADYRSFYDLLGVSIANALAVVRAREDERRRAEALAEIDRAKTAFFSNVSHEFRTPLTLMLGPLEETLTRSAHLAPADREQLETVQRNSLRLLKLVNTLLDFSRIEAGRVQAVFAPVDLALATAELASVFRSAVTAAGLKLTIECPPLPEPAYVDRDMWEKIVLNLVSNAFKFTFEGEIRVSLREDGDRFELRVRDTGTGIPADELPKVFERFHRVAGAHGRTHEGSGIGLALVQELVKLHGGSVAVASVMGQGTTFTVTIPRGHRHLPEAQIGAVRKQASTALGAVPFVQEALRWLPGTSISDEVRESHDSPADSAVEALPVMRARVVLADDNADMRDYVHRLLASRHEVEAVADGEAALEAIARRKPDLVLSDIMMPRLDGMQLLARLRADPRTSTIPVILLSARAGEESRVEGMEAGADDYLIKPFSARELLARVDAHLRMARYRAEFTETLRASEERFRNLADNISQLAWTCDALGEATWYNKRWLEYTGLTFEQMKDWGWKQVHHPEHMERVMAGIRRSREAGEPWEDTFPLRGKDGRYRWFLSRAVPIRDEAGNVVRWFGTNTDITRQREAEESLKLADQRKNEYVAMLAHELRSPLAPISNSAELLRLKAEGDGWLQAVARVIDRQVRHMARLLDDLLDVSRITQHKITLQQCPLAVSTIVARAVETTRPAIAARGHRLHAPPLAEGMYVLGDLTRLTQALGNVLNNAAKYTPEGGNIWLRTRVSRGAVEIVVRDDGIGIAPEVLPQVFELFVQANQGADRSQGGLGIGLALVRKILDLHGGNVEAASDGPGKGATFTLRLPLHQQGEQKLAAEEAAQPPGESKRILVVEDNVDTLVSMKLLLESYGHAVVTAENGADALSAALSSSFDVVLCDIGLPGGMTGYEIARALGGHASRSKMSLIALSGYGREDDQQRSRQAGFDHHFVKPIEMSVLSNLLRNLGAGEGGRSSR